MGRLAVSQLRPCLTQRCCGLDETTIATAVVGLRISHSLSAKEFLSLLSRISALPTIYNITNVIAQRCCV